MSYKCLFFSLLTALFASSAFAGESTGDIANYQVKFWADNKLGNHRAVISVNSDNYAQIIHIPWRLRDRKIAQKAILIFDSKGNAVKNILPLKINNESCSIAFGPVKKGQYYLYYLTHPYPARYSSNIKPYYLALRGDLKSPWASKVIKEYRSNQRDKLPKAKLICLQARTPIESFFPMEVVATKNELKQMLRKYSNPYLIFCEDRTRSIRMRKDLPYQWVKVGPKPYFKAVAHRGEYYVFQIGVYAAKTACRNLKINFSPLKGQSGSIPVKNMTCFNLGGTNIDGKQFTKKVNVKQGEVQALWVGIKIPDNAKGSFSGNITLRGDNIASKKIPIKFDINQKKLPNNGFDNIHNLSRLKWLNSKIGHVDKVIAPFIPVTVNKNNINILNREITLGKDGLPQQISSKGLNILNRPISFLISSNSQKYLWQSQATKFIKNSETRVDSYTKSKSNGLSLIVNSTTEFDGTISYKMVLSADKTVHIKNAVLKIPYRKEMATYMMGMGKEGGYTPAKWSWKWNRNYANNQIWVGEVNGGIQLQLKTNAQDYWDVISGLTINGLPKSWYNLNRGGCLLTRKAKEVCVSAYTGRFTMQKGQSKIFYFRLLITPFKNLNPQFGMIQKWGNGGNIAHIHHASVINPFINYPFIGFKKVAEVTRKKKNVKQKSIMARGKLTYPATGNILEKSGTISIWAQLRFTPDKVNHELLNIVLKNGNIFNIYWNYEDRNFRAVIGLAKDKKQKSYNFPVVLRGGKSNLKNGDLIKITVSWGDKICLFVNGQLLSSRTVKQLAGIGTMTGAKLELCSDFNIDALKISDSSCSGSDDKSITVTIDANTLLLDKFTNITENSSIPERSFANSKGKFFGQFTKGRFGPRLVLQKKYKPAFPLQKEIEYLIGDKLNTANGSLHIKAKLAFNGTKNPRPNRQLASFAFANNNLVGVYWNERDKGFRSYIYDAETKKHPMVMNGTRLTTYPGEEIIISLSWGKEFACYINGRRTGVKKIAGLNGNISSGALLKIFSQDIMPEAIMINRTSYNGAPITMIPTADTSFFDDFKNIKNNKVFPVKPASGIVGDLLDENVMNSQSHNNVRNTFGTDLYYTVRELTNYARELWVLKSLGNEILNTHNHYLYSINGSKLLKPGGGSYWLQEHLRNGYVPAWRTQTYSKEFGGKVYDAAIGINSGSRWENHYLEGLDWILKNSGVDGLYLDGIGYDVRTMRRAARILAANRKNYRIKFHSGNYNSRTMGNIPICALNRNMEHLPYVTNLWAGEMFDYNKPADYWLINYAGLPFGLYSTMLSYRYENPYRSMLFGMSAHHQPFGGVYRLWDKFGIADARMIGWWDKNSPVTVSGLTGDNKCTIYLKKDKALIAVADWTNKLQKKIKGKLITVNKAPTIDGKIEVAEWSGIKPVSNFTILRSTKISKNKTQAWLTSDGKYLYFAFRVENCPNPKAFKIGRDAQVWQDDAVELFIQTDLSGDKYYQFIGNSRGAIFDSYGTRAHWNGNWTYRARVDRARKLWECEGKIRVTDLGLKQINKSTIIKVNFARDNYNKPENSTWGPTRSYHDISSFGIINFNPAAKIHNTLKEQIKLQLHIDWEKLGFDPKKTTITSPAIRDFQDYLHINKVQPSFNIKRNTGRVFILETKK